jgi:GTP cyclohydrolase I
MEPRSVERAVEELIRALSLDPAREPELKETPARLADLYAEVFAGLDPAARPSPVTFPHEGGEEEVVAVRDLQFYSMCVHHLVPFFGVAHVAYVPAAKIVGISGPARILDYHSRRPQLQERLTREVADHLEEILAPRGLLVVLRARHLCMEMRGVRRRGEVETRVARGVLAGAAGAALFPESTGEPGA